MSSQPIDGPWFGIAARSELPATRRQGISRYFFVVLAVLYALVAVGGFAPEMLGSVDLAHPRIAYAHGALMSAWLLLFIVQTSLAASGVLKWHRKLGLAAIGLAMAVWISMGIASVAQLSKFPYYGTLLLQLVVMALFAMFFVWGVLVRRDASSHKRLLTLATLVLLQAAVDRMSWLPDFGVQEYWPYALRLYVLLIPLVVFDVVSTKRIHPVTLLGTVAIVTGHAAVGLFEKAPGWVDFAGEMTAPFR